MPKNNINKLNNKIHYVINFKTLCTDNLLINDSMKLVILQEINIKHRFSLETNKKNYAIQIPSKILYTKNKSFHFKVYSIKICQNASNISHTSVFSLRIFN